MTYIRVPTEQHGAERKARRDVERTGRRYVNIKKDDDMLTVFYALVEHAKCCCMGLLVA